MRIIKNTEISQTSLSKEQTLWVYCGLDCTLTHEIWTKIEKDLGRNDHDYRKTYQFELDMLKPAMHMMLRGLKVDEKTVGRLKAPLVSSRVKLERMLHLFANAVWDRDLNHNSPTQLKSFLYEWLGLPEVISYVKGKQKVSTDKEALEHLIQEYPRARPFCRTILALRDIDKQLNILNAKRDGDGRMRCSFKVAGTETGRWASSESPWGTGTNLQNITKDMREIFVPDGDNVLFYADLEQAESRVTAYVAGDQGYINACEGEDLHTQVVKMVWPNMGWSSDRAQNRELADRPYIGHFSYRDMCKRAGHGTNYGLSATSLGRHLKIKLSHATRFQLLYYGGVIALASLERWHKQDREGGFQELIDGGTVLGSGPSSLVRIEGAFPGIRKWHNAIAAELKESSSLTTPLGRRRQFWGRIEDGTTLRKAIAYVPQSTIGDLLNLGLYRVWNELKEDGVDILGQVHDAILGQFPKDKADVIVPKILNCMKNPMEVNGRQMIIPSDCEIGSNWKDMKKYVNA